MKVSLRETNPKKIGQKKKGGKNPWADHLTRKAKKEKYPARSVYKLEEIQQVIRLRFQLRPTNRTCPKDRRRYHQARFGLSFDGPVR